MALNSDVAAAVREVTPDEISFYQQNGWAKLENFITPELAGELLTAVQSKMGERPQVDEKTVGIERAGGAASDTRKFGGEVKNYGAWQDYHYIARDDKIEPCRSLVFSEEMGRNAQRLMQRDIPIKYMSDLIACKMPVGQAGSDATGWHQDHVSTPFDRAGELNFWIALYDCPRERGPMRFLSGSHRAGPLGRTRAQGKDLLDYYPTLANQYPMSPELDLRAGDATVHNAMVAHGASQNTTDTPRWSYILTYFPADALWTGATNHNFDGIGLTVNGTMDHPRFPVVYQ